MKHIFWEFVNKILHILLAFAFIINSFGYILLFEQQRYEAELEMKERIGTSIPLSDLTVIAIPKKGEMLNINWKDENEFEFEGKMYDIVKKTESADSLTFYCINDVKEENIIEGLIKCYDDLAHGRKHSPSQQRILKNIITLGLLDNRLYMANTDNLISDFISKDDLYTSIKLSIPTKPPNNFSL